ncbi:MAG: Wzz/FepE/Etk N-terminal domain-containing protein [Verrucomicrobiota bacterium]
MTNKIDGLFRVPSPTAAFFGVAMVVFLLTLGTSIVITFLLPESYSSTTRIKVEKDADEAGNNGLSSMSFDPYFIQTTFEIMQSGVVLNNAIASLDLNDKWGKKFNHGEPLKTSETMEILKNSMVLNPVRNTKLITITVYSDDPKEAAQIANAMAVSYRAYRVRTYKELALQKVKVLQKQYQQDETDIEQTRTRLYLMREQLKVGDEISSNPTPQEQAYWDEKEELYQMLARPRLLNLQINAIILDAQIPQDSMVQIVDSAVPGHFPVKPNKPLNISIGIIGGGFLGLFVGTIAMAISLQLRKRNGRKLTPA